MSHAEDSLERLAQRMLDLDEQIATLKEDRKMISAVIESLVDEDDEMAEVAAGAFAFLVKRTRTYKWDTDELRALCEAGEIAPPIQQKLSIGRKDYEAMSLAERKKLEPALTIKPGAATVKVKENRRRD